MALQMTWQGAWMPTSLKEGRGKEYCRGGGRWEEQWQLYRHTGDKGYFKSQYIELVITF